MVTLVSGSYTEGLSGGGFELFVQNYAGKPGDPVDAECKGDPSISAKTTVSGQ